MLRNLCYWPPRQRRQVKGSVAFNAEDGVRQCESILGIDYFRRVNKRRVLDVGCGAGAAILTLASSAKFAVGVDPATTIESGQTAKLEGSVEAVSFVRGSAASLSDNCFDLAISHDAFEHLDDPSEVLEEMVRVVRYGGEIVVKFGPTWRGPWGRHMSGTYRKDRPWIHLLFPEKSVMRAWSTYNNWPTGIERYADLPGGMNKMTVRRCLAIFESTPGLKVDQVILRTVRNLPVRRIPILKELLSTEMTIQARCI